MIFKLYYAINCLDGHDFAEIAQMTIGEIMPENKTRSKPKTKEKMEQITIKLPPKMLEGLRKLSNMSYNPMSMHIRQAIAEYLERNNNKN